MRLDLNDDAAWSLQYEGTDMSPPPLRQAWASTLLTDGATLAAAAYDNRRLRLRLDLYAASLDDAYGHLQALYRELDRPTNLLRWQPQGATSPVFFRTIRSMNNRVVEHPGTGLLRTVDVEVDAEPFAYGLPETIGPVTVYNDPAALANASYVDLTGVKGDVETPLRITIPQAGGLVDPDQMSVMAIRRRGTPSQMPLVLQAEAMTQGTDTSTQAAAEDASGTGNKWSRTTFATVATAPATRLSIATWPTGNNADVRGRYRVLARVRTTVAGDLVYAQLRWGLTGPSAGNGEVSIGWNGSAGYTGWKLVDLGLISFPAGADPGTDGLSGAPLTARGQYLQIDVRRQSGTGNLDWDYLLFVPADDRLAVIDWGDIAVSGGQVVVDSTTETIYPVDGGGVVYGGGTPPSTTGWMMASPGVTNRLVWLRSAGPLGADSTTATTSLTIGYLPRYLYARPVSS